MKARMQAHLLSFFVMVAMAVCVYPQSAAHAPAPAANVLPEPYGADEFPLWMRGVRRFEIISIGVFPVVLFYTRLGFDLYRYVSPAGLSAERFQSIYLPWPFKNEFSYKPTDDEQMQAILVAGLASLVFGGIDALIRWKPETLK